MMSQPDRLILVGCSAAKLPHQAPAKDLYQGQLFKLARQYAESQDCPWLILSGLHGIVDPDKVIRPYEFDLRQIGKGKRDSWGVLVSQQLRRRNHYPHYPETGPVITVLASRSYVEPITHLITVCSGHPVDLPLQGLGIGQQLHWLKQQTK